MYLNCKTYFSFRYGTMSHKQLVDAAIEQGVSSLALTNINSTCDTWDFVHYCIEKNIKPVAGAEIRNDDQFLYILLAANNNGFEWINSFISCHLEENIPFPLKAEEPFFADTKDGYVIYPLNTKEPTDLFSNEKIGVRPSEVNKIFASGTTKYPGSYVIHQPVTFLTREHFNVHRLLRAIDKNVLLSKLLPEDICAEDEQFVSPSTLLAAFKNYPAIVTNTYKLLESCSIEIEFHKDKNKKVFSASEEDDRILLAKLAMDGMGFR